MGRGLFSGRSTPALDSPPSHNISTPTLVSTDAQPRDDLHDLGEESFSTGSGRMKSRARKEDDRPKTAEGRSRARSRSRADSRAARPPPSLIDNELSFFPIANPTPTYSNEDHNDAMIGMALGSPRGDPNWSSPPRPSEPLETPSLPMTTILGASDDGLSKPKNTKWKKLGGFFGGRRQQDSPSANQSRSFWDVYAQHAQAQAPLSSDAQHPPRPNAPPARSITELKVQGRPTNPPPYSFAAPPREESLVVPVSEVRLTPSPIEEVEQEIDKMMQHNSWEDDDSLSSPVDEVDEIPLREPPSPETPKLEHQIPPKKNPGPSSPPVKLKDTDDESEIVLFRFQQSPPPETTTFLNAPFNLGSGPLLDVEIPSVQMDRYSVMFGSLLKFDTKPEDTKADTKPDQSSILARRQVDKHLGRLKTIPDLGEKVEEELPKEQKSQDDYKHAVKGIMRRRMDGRPVDQSYAPQLHGKTTTTCAAAPAHERGELLEVKPQRRATSPSPIRSPSFSLFPAAHPKAPKMHGPHSTPVKPSGLQRSRTAPSAISPNRATFESDSQTSHHQPEQILFRVQSPSKTASSSSSNPQKWSSDMSLTSPASTVSSDDEEGEELILRQKSLVPLVEQEEPAWEMVVSAKPSAKALKHATEDTGLDECPQRNVPQISVARQISIAKRRRQQSIKKETRVERDHLDVNEHLIDRLPQTPTLVEPQHGHRPKKSQNIVIESI